MWGCANFRQLNAFVHPWWNPFLKPLVSVCENEHIYENQAITEQRNNCENEFILPGLSKSFRATTVHLGPIQNCGASLDQCRKTISYTIRKTSADWICRGERRCRIAPVEFHNLTYAKCKSNYLLYNPTAPEDISPCLNFLINLFKGTHARQWDNAK